MSSDSTETQDPATETENVQPDESVDTENSNDDSNDETTAAAESTDAAEMGQPEFAELDANSQPTGPPSDLSRLNEVQVTIAAEIGRTSVPIHELLKLTEGSVFELNRSIENPVELRAQDVPLGNGEVVVVDGNFAIRIQEIYKKENDV